jgi:hypothetical protein
LIRLGQFRSVGRQKCVKLVPTFSTICSYFFRKQRVTDRNNVPVSACLSYCAMSSCSPYHTANQQSTVSTFGLIGWLLLMMRFHHHFHWTRSMKVITLSLVVGTFSVALFGSAVR